MVQRGSGAYAAPAVWRAAGLLIVLAMAACAGKPQDLPGYRSARAVAEYSLPEPVLEMIAPGPTRRFREMIRKRTLGLYPDHEIDGVLAEMRKHALADRKGLWDDMAEELLEIYTPGELELLRRFHETSRTVFLKLTLAGMAKALGEQEVFRLLTGQRDRFPDMPLLMDWLEGGGGNIKALGFLSEAEKKKLALSGLLAEPIARKEKQKWKAFGKASRAWVRRAGRGNARRFRVLRPGRN